MHRARALKIALKLVGVTILVLVSIPVSLWALVHAPVASVAPLLARAVPGIELHKVRGALAGPLSIERLVYDDAHLRLELQQVQLDWHYRHGLHIDVLNIAAGELRWKGASPAADTASPWQLPPFAIDLPRANIEQFVVQALNQRVRLEKITAKLTSDAHSGIGLALRSNGDAVDFAGTLTPPETNLRLTLQAFNPATLGEFPAARIGGELRARMRQATVDLDWRIDDSEWNGRRLSTTGTAQLAAAHLNRIEADARIGTNSLQVHGSLGEQDTKLNWRLAANDLAQLAPSLRGSIAGDGSVAGRIDAPRVQARLHATALALNRNYRLKRADVRITHEGAGNNKVAAELSGVRTPQLKSTEVQLHGDGTASAHRFTVTAQCGTTTLNVAANGAWKKLGWQGAVTQLTLNGPYPIRLAAPAQVTVARDAMRLEDARLQIAGGTVTLRYLRRERGVLTTAGEVAALPIAPVQQWLPNAIADNPSLVVGGRWSLQLGESADGEVKLWRERGDLTLLSTPPQRLGLEDVEARAEIKKGEVKMFAYVRGSKVGELRAQARTMLTRRDGVWGVTRDAPLTLDIDAQMPDIAWAGVLSDRVSDVGGAIAAQLHAQGPLTQPQWRGFIRGSALRVTQPDFGVQYRDGTFEAILAGAQLKLTQANFKSANGSIDVTGNLDLHRQDGNFAVTAHTLDVMRDADRNLQASGHADVRVQDNRVTITGAATVDRARIDLPKEDGPTASDDIVIVGDDATVADTAAVLPTIDVQVDLGEHFFVKGRGADVQLGGRVHLRNRDNAVSAIGIVKVVRGSYAAYGQRLTIDRGVLTFNGPLDNPALDILALRKNQAVQAGVQVSGTALIPVVKLVSIPQVSDSEKLAWLVLGHGLDKTDRGEFNVLNQAAGALLAQGESVSLQAKLAQYFGVDELRLSGGSGLEQAIVTVGKRVSSALYLTYERGVSNTSNMLRLRYTLSPRWSVQTEAGNKDNAVDLFYTLSFD